MYAISTQLLSAIILLIGLALIVSTLARGAGVLAVGVVFGFGLMALGAARIWLARGSMR